MLALLPGGPWSTDGAAVQTLPGYANSLSVLEIVSPTGRRKVIAKVFEDARLPELRARLQLHAGLGDIVNRESPGSVPPTEALGDVPGGAVQLLSFVDSVRLYDAVKAAAQLGDDTLVGIGHAFGVALGRLGRSLRSARPTLRGPTRVLAGCDALAYSPDPTAEAPALQAAPAPDRIGSWDMRHVGLLGASNLSLVRDPATASLLGRALALVEREVAHHYAAAEDAVAGGVYTPERVDLLTLGWVHGDANCHNVLLRRGQATAHGRSSSSNHDTDCPSSGGGDPDGTDPRSYVFIDWEDAAFSYALHDLAIALTYLLLDSGGLMEAATAPSSPGGAEREEQGGVDGTASARVLRSACAMVRSYSSVTPLKPVEAQLLPALIASRLTTSLLQSARAAQAASDPSQREYVLVHAAPAIRLLSLLVDAPGARNVLGEHLVAAAGLTATVSRPPRSYVYRPQLSPDQVRSSRIVAAALQWLGASESPQDAIMAVVRHDPTYAAATSSTAISSSAPPLSGASAASSAPSQDGCRGDSVAAAAAGAGKAGWIPSALHFPAPAAAAAAPPSPAPDGRVRWPRPPFVYDFGPGNASLGGVVGTDPAKLAAFTQMMFDPLQPPPPTTLGLQQQQPQQGGASSSSSSSSSGDTAHAPAAPWLTPVSAGGRGVYRIGWGQYGEARMLYQSEHFTAQKPAASPSSSPSDLPSSSGSGDATSGTAPSVDVTGPAYPRPDYEPRTVHLGVDLEAPAGTPVHAPLGGTVHSTARNVQPLDYGPTVILRHTLLVTLVRDRPEACGGDAAEAARALQQPQERHGHPTPSPSPAHPSPSYQAVVLFYTLYGHLSLDSLVGPGGIPRLVPGQPVRTGAIVGWVGPEAVNGGWPPHLHFQVDTEEGHGGWVGDYPGVCAGGDWAAYGTLCPDPNLLLRCPYVAPVGWDPAASTRLLAPEGVLAVPVAGTGEVVVGVKLA